MSQTDSLLRYLERHPKGISPLTALEWLGTFRLAARVHELRAQGHRIETRFVNLSGGGRVANYVLLEKKSPR